MRIAFLLLMLLVAAPTFAQDTGGTAGGFDSSGSSGGGSSYSGGSSSYSGGSYSNDSYGSSGSGGGGGLGGGICGLLCLFSVIFIGAVINAQIVKRRVARGGHGQRAWTNVDVSALQLAIDWRARREVQAQLEQLAKSADSGSKAGLVAVLRDTTHALQRAKLAWLYGGITNHHPMNAASAEGIFRQLVGDARAKYKKELVHEVDGHHVETDAGQQRARAEEGEGVVVVTLVVAARREIPDVTNSAHAPQISALLESYLQMASPEVLVGAQVVWSPAAENDRLSTAELEVLYPSLKKIDDATIAGRVFCSYCRWPFAAEIGACPHCGAELDQA
jgi:uncharacterized membrane protein